MAKKTSKSTKTKTAKVSDATVVVSLGVSDKLRMWSLRLGIVLLLEAVAVVVFGKAYSAAVHTQFLAVDPLATEAAGHQVLATATRHLFDAPMVWVVAVGLLLVSAVYVLAATVFKARYDAAVVRGYSEFRWLSLGLGGAVMTVAIALLSGVSQATTLLMLAGYMVVGTVAMLVAEALYANFGAKRFLPHVACGLGVVSFVLPWVVFAKVAASAVMFDGVVPGYLWAIYGTYTLFLLAAGLATHFRIVKKGRFADAIYTECVFLFLGFVAASVLAWQIFAGVLM